MGRLTVDTKHLLTAGGPGMKIRFALILPVCSGLFATPGAAQLDASHSPKNASNNPALAPAARHELPNVPAVRWFTDRHRQFVLIEPFKYQPPNSSEAIVVPAGFVTDFASIPDPMKMFFGPSVHDLPALVHDFLYWRQSCTREQADKVFYQALDYFGVSKVRRKLIEWGLGLRGEKAYRTNASDRNARLPRIVPNYNSIPVTTWAVYRRQLRSQGAPLDPPDAKRPAYCGSA
jgi:hypothetical protein